jgi:hypothetical protein
MTLIFPFAGARGGFFHSGSALQTVWWALVPVGLEQVIRWGRERRGWQEVHASPVFLGGLVGMAVLFSILVALIRIPSWGQESSAYRQIDEFLVRQGMSEGDIVIVSNPPGFYLVSRYQAIAIPDGTIDTIFELGERYSADYLILENGSTPAGLIPVYDNPNIQPGLIYLGEVEEARVFAILP